MPQKLQPAPRTNDCFAGSPPLLALHFPRSAGDTNELPDKLIEL